MKLYTPDYSNKTIREAVLKPHRQMLFCRLACPADCCLPTATIPSFFYILFLQHLSTLISAFLFSFPLPLSPEPNCFVFGLSSCISSIQKCSVFLSLFKNSSLLTLQMHFNHFKFCKFFFSILFTQNPRYTSAQRNTS